MNTTTDSRTSVSATAPATPNSFVNSSWYAYQESNTNVERVAGAYVYTVVVTPNPGVGTAQTADITITVAASAADSLVASAAFSTLYINPTSGTQADAAVSGLATASDTAKGFLNLTLRNASGTSGTAARESVTITTTIGTVGDGSVRGRSIVVKYNAAGVNYSIFSDGTAVQEQLLFQHHL